MKRIDRLEQALRHCLRLLERADRNFGSDAQMDQAAAAIFSEARNAAVIAREALGDAHLLSVTPMPATAHSYGGWDITCSCGWHGGRYVARGGAIVAGDQHGRFE